MNFLKEAVDKLKSIGRDAKKLAQPRRSSRNRKSFPKRLGIFLLAATVKAASASGLLAASGVKNLRRAFTGPKAQKKSRKTESSTIYTKQPTPKRTRPSIANTHQQANSKTSKKQKTDPIRSAAKAKKKENIGESARNDNSATIAHFKAYRQSENPADRYAEVIEQTNTYSEAQRQARIEKEQRLLEQKEPQPFREPEVQADGRLEPSKSFTCQYTCCAGERYFSVTLSQLDWYYRRGLNDPKACYACRKRKYDLLQNPTVIGECPHCKKEVSVPSEVWQMHYKDKGQPSFYEYCQDHTKHEKEKEQANVDRQLSTQFASGTEELNQKMEASLKYRFKGGSKEEFKQREKLEGKAKQVSHINNQNLCQPLKDFPRIPDMEFYRNTIRPDGDSLYDHIDSHFIGKRQGENYDNSLASEFASTEKAIEYAHYVASLDNPKQFADFQDPRTNNFIRIDKVRGLEIVYSHDEPRRVVSMYKPNYDSNDSIPEEMRLVYRISGHLNKEEQYQNSVRKKARRAQRKKRN